MNKTKIPIKKSQKTVKRKIISSLGNKKLIINNHKNKFNKKYFLI